MCAMKRDRGKENYIYDFNSGKITIAKCKEYMYLFIILNSIYLFKVHIKTYSKNVMENVGCSITK
jgi:hypothetical protein